jgi:predicted TIM-barrel fold metal-dependent hydrolase
MMCDAHCHFFSANFFSKVGAEAGVENDAPAALATKLGWTPPGDDKNLADVWVAELDRHAVDRAMLIASVPGDESSVAAAAERHPSRFVGAFMLNAGAPDAIRRADWAFSELGLRTACLFPAMHHVSAADARTEAVFASAARHGGAVFVHCGVLSVGIRKKLGLPSFFDLRLGDPLALAAVAVRHSAVPVIIPHFGAGFFREALMAAGAAQNILLDTSSSNSWIRLYPGLTLREVFARALDIAGATRLLFGTDSSFFPRGWQKPVYDEQRALLTDLGVSTDEQALIFGGNFERVFTSDP